jgi:V8-like Glu-specific endopeptidase
MQTVTLLLILLSCQSISVPLEIGTGKEVGLRSETGERSSGPNAAYKEHAGVYTRDFRLKGAARELQAQVCDENKMARVRNTQSPPWSAVVSLTASFSDGESDVHCSGAFFGPRAILTASSCFYDNQRGGFADSVEVCPGLNGKSKPYGCTDSVLMMIKDIYTNFPDERYGYGLLLMESDEIGKEVDYYFGFKVEDVLGKEVHAAGYPLDKGGNELWHTTGVVTASDEYYNFQVIDMGTGMKGGPLYVEEKGGSRYIVGIMSSQDPTCESLNQSLRVHNKWMFDDLKLWRLY